MVTKTELQEQLAAANAKVHELKQALADAQEGGGERSREGSLESSASQKRARGNGDDNAERAAQRRRDEQDAGLQAMRQLPDDIAARLAGLVAQVDWVPFTQSLVAALRPLLNAQPPAADQQPAAPQPTSVLAGAADLSTIFTTQTITNQSTNVQLSRNAAFHRYVRECCVGTKTEPRTLAVIVALVIEAPDVPLDVDKRLSRVVLNRLVSDATAEGRPFEGREIINLMIPTKTWAAVKELCEPGSDLIHFFNKNLPHIATAEARRAVYECLKEAFFEVAYSLKWAQEGALAFSEALLHDRPPFGVEDRRHYQFLDLVGAVSTSENPSKRPPRPENPGGNGAGRGQPTPPPTPAKTTPPPTPTPTPANSGLLATPTEDALTDGGDPVEKRKRRRGKGRR